MVNNNLVSVIIVNYKGRKFLPGLFRSLKEQTFKNTETIFIDNASNDDSPKWVRENYPETETAENKNNLGYAGGANQGINKSKGDYVLILNPDLILEENFIEKLFERAKKDKKIGAVSGKLLHLNFSKNKKTDIIDSTGILAKKSGFFADRGQGKVDSGQYKSGEVFGVSGAAMFLNRKALEDAKIKEEYFDNDFHSYKEDIDLSWQLRLRDWKCFFEEEAVAYHARALKQKEGGTISKIRNREDFYLISKKLSYRNHYLLLFKNTFFQNAIRPQFLIPFLWFEFKKLFYVIFFEPYLFFEDIEIAKLLPKILKKRKEIMHRRKASPKEIRRWFK